MIRTVLLGNRTLKGNAAEVTTLMTFVVSMDEKEQAREHVSHHNVST